MPPDLFSLLSVESIIFYLQVYTTENGVVEVDHTVRGEEQNTVEILELSKKDRDQPVVKFVIGGPTFQEDVGFVQEQYSIGMLGYLEDICKGSLQLPRLCN